MPTKFYGKAGLPPGTRFKHQERETDWPECWNRFAVFQVRALSHIRLEAANARIQRLRDRKCLNQDLKIEELRDHNLKLIHAEIQRRVKDGRMKN